MCTQNYRKKELNVFKINRTLLEDLLIYLFNQNIKEYGSKITC